MALRPGVCSRGAGGLERRKLCGFENVAQETCKRNVAPRSHARNVCVFTWYPHDIPCLGLEEYILYIFTFNLACNMTPGLSSNDSGISGPCKVACKMTPGARGARIRLKMILRLG